MSNELTIPKHIAIFISGSKLKPISEVMSLSPDERLDQAVLGDHLELIGVLYKGFCLLDLKDELGHGSYLEGLASRSIEPKSAWRAQSLAKLSLRVSPSNFPALSDLTPTKLALLVKWTDDELNAFFSGDEVKGLTHDIATVIASREMDRQLRNADLSNNELQQQLEKERSEKEQAQRENILLKRQKNEPLGFIYPDSIEQVRIESSALANQIVQCLDDMQQLIVVLNSAQDLDDEDPNKSDAEYSAGASALAVNLTATYSKASFLLANFRNMVGTGFIPEQPEDTPLLTEEEALRVHNMREYMLAEHEIEKAARQNTRLNKRK